MSQNQYLYKWKSSSSLSWQWLPSYRNQSIDLLCKSMDWFICDRDFHHQRVKWEFTIWQRERERQSKNARSRSYPRSRFKSLRCNNWKAKDEMAWIISKPKQTWQEQVLIKLCCWMHTAQKQSMTPNFFFSMISIRVQICIYHIRNMTTFH